MTTTVSELSDNESTTESCPTHPSSAISEHSLVTGTPQAIRDWLMSSPPGFPANHSQMPVNNLAQMIPVTCGPQLSKSSARFDPRTCSLKTFQACLIPGISEPSLETWPKAGIVFGGEFYPQPKWERRTSVIVSGLLPTPTATDETQGERLGGASEIYIDKTGKPRRRMPDGESASMGLGKMAATGMWPTPSASDGTGGPGNSGRQCGLNLRTAVMRFSTPTAQMAKHADPSAYEEENRQTDLHVQVGGQLSPEWVEWLMGWPIGWTDIEPLPQSASTDWQNETMRGQWWQHEHDLPRIAKGIPNRTNRLRAIGNGQVPAVIGAAWKILTDEP